MRAFRAWIVSVASSVEASVIVAFPTACKRLTTARRYATAWATANSPQAAARVLFAPSGRLSVASLAKCALSTKAP